MILNINNTISFFLCYMFCTSLRGSLHITQSKCVYSMYTHTPQRKSFSGHTAELFCFFTHSKNHETIFLNVHLYKRCAQR